MTLVFKNARIVGRNKVVRGSLSVENGRIRAIGKAPGRADAAVDCRGRYLIPGFFETHMHGIAHYCGIRGYQDPSLNQENAERPYGDAIHHIMEKLPDIGVTSAYLSSFTTERRLLDRFLSEAGRYLAKPYTQGHARLRGIDLEGNFLKEAAFAGAQNASLALEPSIETFETLQELSGGHIKKALIAPEWGEPAFTLIRHMARKGLQPSVGHTGCTRDQMLKAQECGTRVVVHCGNGPMSQNFKSGGALDGIFELGPKLYGEIICDLSHVHPRWINTFINCFSMERVLGISDAMALTNAGLNEGQLIDGCIVRKGALWIVGKTNTLAGSISPLNRQYNNMLNLLTSDRKAYFQLKTPEPLSLDAALPLLSRMYSLNAAELDGCEAETGSLEKGKQADILLADITGRPGHYRFKLDAVYIGGERAGK